MTHIHENAQAVHFLHHFATERTKPTVFCIAASRVANIIVTIVAKRHIDNAALLEMLEQAEIASDGVPVLDASQDSFFPLCLEAQDVFSCLCQTNAVAVSPNNLFNLCE